MDYDARKDSLLSEQESEKVEIYISARNINVPVLVVETHLQEGNKPRKNIYHSKPTQINGQRTDFADSMIIEYFFECNSKLIQTDKNFSFKSLMPHPQAESPSAELSPPLESYLTEETKESSKKL